MSNCNSKPSVEDMLKVMDKVECYVSDDYPDIRDDYGVNILSISRGKFYTIGISWRFANPSDKAIEEYHKIMEEANKNKVFVSAGFKNTPEGVKECQERVRAGEVFYYTNSYIVCYEESKLLEGQTPFRVVHTDNKEYNDPVKRLWNFINKLKVKKDWRDSVSEENPVWCEVWDGYKVNYKRYDLIHSYLVLEDYPYRGVGIFWSNARPVSESMAKELDKTIE
ncbi:MAG: hypothetical protein KUG64_10830 [Cycloclasticus sp.]|nr:hypothetical protein [Cycloclasticus sp.]